MTAIAAFRPMKKPVPAPTGLSRAARGWWAKLAADYGIDDSAGLLILESALRSFDRAEAAREILDREGIVTTDSRGRPKQHPAVSAERDARAAFLTALGKLNLDVLPARDVPGRPLGGSR